MKNNPVVLSLVSAAVIFCGPAALPVSAQLAVPPPMPAYQPLSDQQLDQLLAPIALYPDPLLAQILPASTLPTQIVLADRYVASGGDPNLIYQQPWDPSVQALARYPSVLQYLDNNLAWTTEVGEAFVNQQEQVMDSIQRLRLSAQNFGNLVSTPQDQVVEGDGDIEILPVDPNVIYVPIYQPDLVYYQSGCPLSFGLGIAIGSWLDCDFDWHGHHLFFWGPGHPRPGNWWHQSPNQRAAWLAREGTVWRPEDHGHAGGARSGDRGWNNQAPAPRNNSVAWTRPNASPRPAAQLRPAAGNPSADRGAFIGSASSRAVRNDSDRGQESLHAVERAQPAPVERAQPESHSAPAPEIHESGSQRR